MFSPVSAKLRCPLPSFVTKKNFLFEFEKLRQYSGSKAITSALALGPVRFTTPLPHALVRNTKDKSFSYLWSASWGVFSLQRRGQHYSAPNPAAASK